MKVLKRDGRSEDVQFDKILKRISLMCKDLSGIEDVASIAQEVIARVKSGITTSELDVLAAEFSFSKISEHLDYGTLASRIIIDDCQKNCPSTYSGACDILYNNVDQRGNKSPLVSKNVYDCSKKYDHLIKQDRDFLLDYFGFKTLARSYLLRSGGKVIETPQYMWLRVAIGIHGDNYDLVSDTYELMSQLYFTHATPTLFNAGTENPQLSSCFLVGTEDSVNGIFKTIGDCASISKWAGGVGVHISNIRGKNSYIRGTGGKSDGIVPLLRTYNETARYINQGGKRKGSFAIYLEPWHCDIFSFLECKKNHGDMSLRALDLFYALWIPDLFMKRVFGGDNNNTKWSLMCPSECPGLSDVYGDEFERLYKEYESQGKYKKQVEALDVWNYIINSQIETGTPYMLYKDACNHKSNQKNIGTIKSSNLCSEIVEYSDSREISVCNLASICLPMYVEDNKYNFGKMMNVVGTVVRNLNKIIDINYYPVPEAKKSNMANRPIGVGVQGLADTFMKMGMAYDSPSARKLNKQIFEAIYYASLDTSCKIAQEEEKVYDRFHGSPLSKGIFQFEMWDTHELDPELNLDWESLRTRVRKHGVVNSLVTALMPTASTSQIMGNSECFEPVTSNWYTRRTLAGEFTVMNKYMVQSLMDNGLWTPSVKRSVIINRGSIQNIDKIPQEIRDIYKTVWEIKQKVLVDLSADRGRFVDQSQSLNLYFAVPEYEKLSKAHYYGWCKGLKTGSYYIRSKPVINHDSVTVDQGDCAACSS